MIYIYILSFASSSKFSAVSDLDTFRISHWLSREILINTQAFIKIIIFSGEEHGHLLAAVSNKLGSSFSRIFSSLRMIISWGLLFSANS